MKKNYLLLPLIFLASCGRVQQAPAPPVRLVSDIISDSRLPEHGLVSGFNADDAEKSIYVVGAPDRCEYLRRELVSCDYFDNVDGRMVSDGLPDFAGEVVCTVLDYANAPYQQFLDGDREDRLREVAVRSVIAAMDTVCFISEYDQNGVASKPLPKLLVLESPFASGFGMYDVDSLFSALRCNLPVINPLRAMMDKVFDGRKSNAMVGVITGREYLSTGGYTSYLQEKARSRGLLSSDCVVLPASPDAGDPLIAFLEGYLAAGYSRPLDAILVDDFTVDVQKMRDALVRITDINNGESLSYGKLIAPGCVILDAALTVSSECYRYLRKRNLFTHDIAYPRSLAFRTVAMTDSTFVLTQYSDRRILR